MNENVKTRIRNMDVSSDIRSSLIAHYSFLTAHRSMSNIFTFFLKLQIGVKMNKNHIKQFKNEPKRPSQNALLQNFDFPTEKK